MKLSTLELKDYLGTKEEFELSQRLKELKLNSKRDEFEELRDEDINLDSQE